MRRRIVVAGAAALAVAAGGVAVAATGFGSPQEESTAVIDDAAAQLGVEPAELSEALKQALLNRVDAAREAGRITGEQADALKERIRAEGYPLLGRGLGHHRGDFGRGFGGHGKHLGRGFRHLDAAGEYLGLTREELRTELVGGKTLAQVAEAEGKSLGGLVAALVAGREEKLDAAVAAGRLTRTQADRMLERAEVRVTNLVNGVRPERGRHGFRGPPSRPGAQSSDT